MSLLWLTLYLSFSRALPRNHLFELFLGWMHRPLKWQCIVTWLDALDPNSLTSFHVMPAKNVVVHLSQSSLFLYWLCRGVFHRQRPGKITAYSCFGLAPLYVFVSRNTGGSRHLLLSWANQRCSGTMPGSVAVLRELQWYASCDSVTQGTPDLTRGFGPKDAPRRWQKMLQQWQMQ